MRSGEWGRQIRRDRQSRHPPASRGSCAAPAVVCWGYLIAVVLLWVALCQAESWWPATFLMFSPRWVFAVPFTVLCPVAIYLRSIRLVMVVLVSTLIALVPVAGFNVPWNAIAGSRPRGMPFRVATLNMHYSKGHEQKVEDLIDSTWPDVIAIQEWSGVKDRILASRPDWHTHSTTRLFLASRHPIRRVVEIGDREADWQAPSASYELDTPDGPVTIFNLHTASTREGIVETLRDYEKGSDRILANSDQRRRQSEYIAIQARACTGPVVVVGDFNTPPESPILAEVWRGYTDAFRATGWGFGYTFRGAGTMVRIDHVLVNRKWGVVNCWVGPNVGSPHRPVIADLVRLEN